MCWLLRREKQKRQGFSVFGFKVSFKHGFKGCLMPQDLCVSQTLCFWFISDFAFMGCSFFSFCMYMSIRMTEVWIWISPFMCVLVEMIDLWFFDQNMGFFFFFFLSHWYHIYLPNYGFYYCWDRWVLDFWKLGLFVFVIGIIYTEFFILFYILNYCWDQSLLESWHSYINILSLFVCESYVFL